MRLNHHVIKWLIYKKWLSLHFNWIIKCSTRSEDLLGLIELFNSGYLVLSIIDQINKIKDKLILPFMLLQTSVLAKAGQQYSDEYYSIQTPPISF